MNKIYDILIIGELAGNDFVLAEHLSRLGLKCCVVRKKKEITNVSESISNYAAYHTHFSDKNIIYVKNIIQFIKLAKKSRLILSATAALLLFLKKMWLLKKLLNLPPIINLCTGSDITELAVENSLTGFLYRQYLRYVKINWFPPYPYAIKNIFQLKLKNIVFIPFQYIIPEDNAKYESKTDLTNKYLKFFHPSHLDWKINDPGGNRNSSKGNDRFIRAFARAINKGLNAKCVILDRGPDKEEAKKLIAELGIQKYFEWKSHLTRDEFVKEISASDVVVDQFDVGGLGGIAVESMSLRKPVITYLNENSYKVLYTAMPPVLNAYSENDIYEELLKCRDRKYLQEIGNSSREWVLKNHSWQTSLDRFLFYYTLLTGHKVIDYGWDRTPS